MTAHLQSRKQILVTGCYRTGTEFITQLIGSHPDIEATMYVVNYLRYCLDEYGDINERENLLSLLFDAAQRIRERWNLRLQVQTVADACEKQDELTNGFLYDAMMADLFLDGQRDIWLEKNQLVWTKIPQFLDMFPNGQVIHVHRDPRSVLASFREFTYTPAPAYLSAVFNTLDSMRRSESYRAEYPPERYSTVRYEDIAQQPQKQLEEVFNFLDLPTQKELESSEAWEEPDGSSWTSNSAFGEDDPDQFDIESAINRWKNHLTDWEVNLCEAVNGDVMETFGYERSDRPPVSWEDFVEPLLQRNDLTQYLERWLRTGDGVEAFPTDPLDSQNWSENAD